MALTNLFFEERRITTPFSARRLAAESDFHTARRINGDDRNVCSASSASLNWTCAAAKLGSDEGQWLNDGALGSVVSRTFRTL
jgi:hypothetical protein